MFPIAEERSLSKQMLFPVFSLLEHPARFRPNVIWLSSALHWEQEEQWEHNGKSAVYKCHQVGTALEHEWQSPILFTEYSV